MVTSFPRFGQTYGRFAIRARFPSAKVAGLHSALWLYPANPTKYGAWPASGEIDLAEFYTQYPARAVPFVHYLGDADDPNVTNTKCLISYPERFHSYLVEWTAESITVKHDGVTCIKDTWQPWAPQVKPQPFDQPFVVNLTQAIGSGSNAVTSSTPLPAAMVIDRVRVWK
jgi:beta-glucanase (GH16 family)